MGHPPLLNATCITNLTSTLPNLTSLTPTHLESCTYTIYSEPSFYRAAKTVFLILIVFTATCFLCALCSGHSGNIRRLRNLPPHFLHLELEHEYQKRFIVTKRAKKAWEDNGMESRYLRISYVDDRDARIRTVTIVEDLGKAPHLVQYTGSAGMRTVWQTVGAELREMGGHVNGNGSAAIYRGVAPTQTPGQAQQPSPFVNARVGASSGAVSAALAVPAPAATRSGNGNGNEQKLSGNEHANHGGPPPPPYKQHQGQRIV